MQSYLTPYESDATGAGQIYQIQSMSNYDSIIQGHNESSRDQTEYENEMLDHMLVMESYTRIDVSMMDLQPELKWSMRPFLLDFLLGIHFELKLQEETLFLAINIMDRYVSIRVVHRRHYQLVGMCSLWIAAKYCEKKMAVPTVSELKTLCNAAYETCMFAQMERHILSTLKWSIGHPTYDLYIDYHLNECSLNPESNRKLIKLLAWYLCEIAMYERALLRFTSSVVAVSAVHLAMFLVKKPILRHQSRLLNNTDFASCFELLSSRMMNPRPAVAVKYRRPEFGKVSYLVERSMSETIRHPDDINPKFQSVHHRHRYPSFYGIGINIMPPSPAPSNSSSKMSVRVGSPQSYISSPATTRGIPTPVQDHGFPELPVKGTFSQSGTISPTNISIAYHPYPV